MNEDLDPVCTVRGAEDIPFYLTDAKKSDAFAHLARQAVEVATEEHDLHPTRIVLRTHYSKAKDDPRESYAEVRVYDRLDVAKHLQNHE